MPPCDTEAEILRRALARHDYAGAITAAGRYTKLVESTLPTLPPAAALQLLDHSCQFIEWSRRQLCAARVRLAQRLAQVQSASRYAATPPPSPHTWKINA